MLVALYIFCSITGVGGEKSGAEGVHFTTLFTSTDKNRGLRKQREGGSVGRHTGRQGLEGPVLSLHGFRQKTVDVAMPWPTVEDSVGLG